MNPEEREMQRKKIRLMTDVGVYFVLWSSAVLYLLFVIASNGK